MPRREIQKDSDPEFPGLAGLVFALSSTVEKLKRFFIRNAKILLVVVAFLVLVRALLPIGVQRYVNHQLAHLEDYQGHIGDVDISLLRGAYQIEDIALLKKTGKIPVPFFKVDEADISVEWKALFEGAFVAEIDLKNPELNFIDGPSPAQSQKKIDSDWRTVVDNLVPLKINRLTIRGGEIHFRNLASRPPVDLYLNDVALDGRNFTNSRDVKSALPATVDAKGVAMKEAPFRLRMKMNALAKPMDFDFDAEIRDASLPKLNAFLLEYANMDVKAGKLSVSTEVAAKDGKLAGYVKPVIKGLEVVEGDRDQKEKGNPLSLLWQGIAGTLGDLFQNDDRQAVKVPIEGTLDNPKTDTWAAVGSAFSHAFGTPLKEGIDDSVNLSSASARRKDAGDGKKKDSNREKKRLADPGRDLVRED
jgi:hypothetical protein